MSLPATTPSRLLQGYNLVTRAAKATALDDKGSASATSPKSTSTINVCYGYTSVAQVLQIEASASLGFAGIGGGSARHSFFNSLNITKTSLTVLVHAKYEDRTEFADSPILSEEAKATASKSIATFVAEYGDCYVSSITLGAEYIAAFVFYSESRDEATRIQDSLSASGIMDGISASASFSKSIETVSKSVSARTSFRQILNGIEGQAYPGAEAIGQFALDFPKLAKGSTAVLAFVTSGYEEVSELTDAMACVAENRQYFCGIPNLLTGKLDELADICASREQAKEIKRIYEFYNHEFVDEKLATQTAIMDKDIKAVQKQMASYVRNPTRAIEEIDLQSLQFGTPMLRLSFSQKAAGSCNNGEYHNEVADLSGIIRKLGKLTRIELRGDGTINGLSLSYTISEKKLELRVGDDGNYKANLDLGGEDYCSIDYFHASEWGTKLKHCLIAANGKTVRMGSEEPRASYIVKPEAGEFLVTVDSRWWGSEVVQIIFNFAKFMPAKWVSA